MWTWFLREGELWRGGALVAHGYAGNGEGLNDPAWTDVKSTGPLPVGRYTIGPPEPGHGGYTLRLHPDAETRARIVALGRNPDSFLIHADMADPKLAGTASKGCLILARIYRVMVWESGDHELEVLEGHVVSEPVPPAVVEAKPVDREGNELG